MEANMIPFRHPGQERRRLSIFVAVLATLALVLAFFVVDGGWRMPDAGETGAGWLRASSGAGF